MKNFFSYGLLISLVLLLGAVGFAEERFSSDSYDQRGDLDLRTLAKDNPKLAAFEKKLYDNQLEIQKIVNKYQEKQLSREEAKEKLIPLLKEQQEMRNDPEYLAELALSSRLKQQRF